MFIKIGHSISRHARIMAHLHKTPDENKNWNVSRTCKKSDRSVNEASKKQKLEQQNVKEALMFPLRFVVPIFAS